MAWRTLLLAVFLIFQVQGAFSNMLNVTKEEIAEIKQIKEKIMEMPTHEADFYHELKDFLHPDFVAKLPKDDPQKAGKIVFDSMFALVDNLEDADKLRATMEKLKANQCIDPSKKDEYTEALVNLLKKRLADKFSAAGENAVRNTLKGVFGYLKV